MRDMFLAGVPGRAVDRAENWEKILASGCHGSLQAKNGVI